MSDKNDLILQGIAKQLEGQIYDDLKEEKYRLSVMIKCFRPDFESKSFIVPDPKTALIIIDVLCSILKNCPNDIGSYMYGFERWNKEEQEWEDWDDANGYDILDYEIDENFNLLPPFDEDDCYY